MTEVPPPPEKPKRKRGAKTAARRAKERARARALPAAAAGKAIQRLSGPKPQAAETRPPAKDAPQGLIRGTDAYRRWEASRTLALIAAGLTREAICAHLGMTPDEYRDRRELIRKEADLGDSLLAWADYRASCSRQILDGERALQTAMAKEQAGLQVQALRLLHDIHTDVLRIGIEVGVFTKLGTGTGVMTLADLVRRIHAKGTFEINPEPTT